MNITRSHLRKVVTPLVEASLPKKTFVPGQTYIPASGKTFDKQELFNGIEAILDCWWTEGHFALEFEQAFGKVCGCRYVNLTNSGSSANLLALTALTSKMLGKRALQPGDEVITVACGFPTTTNPILQNRCVAVCVDVDLKTKNVLVDQLKKAITSKTKAVMIAHTLGNPVPLKEVMDLVKAHGLWFIEDCCDALGATYGGKKVGTFGDIATYSFYPAHQMTMGEGGAVVTNNALLNKNIRQFRDWGRDCWCDTGKDNTCKNRFGWQMGELPYGYDHKFIYSQIGYNLKLTDMQAAIGLAQLKKLPRFVTARRKNFALLKKILQKYQHYFLFSEAEPEANPSWFGFTIVVKENAPFTKLALVEYLEQHHVGTRHLFAGNLLRHPAYIGRDDVRMVGTVDNADTIMERGFWIGVHPGITKDMIAYVGEVFDDFMKTNLK